MSVLIGFFRKSFERRTYRARRKKGGAQGELLYSQSPDDLDVVPFHSFCDVSDGPAHQSLRAQSGRMDPVPATSGGIASYPSEDIC